MSEALNELETAALENALQGDAPWFVSLRKQVPHLRVKSRSYTSAGGYTKFEIHDLVEKASIPKNDECYPPVVLVRHPSLPHGGAFIVWTKDGQIASLEANADGDGAWPLETSEVSDFVFVRAAPRRS